MYADPMRECRHIDYAIVDRETSVETPCYCKDFEVKKATVTQKRSWKTQGSKFELEVARLFGGRKISGAGNPDVVVGPEGEEILVLECHFAQDAKTYGIQLDKLLQAERHAFGRKGAPEAAYVYRLKLQAGEKHEHGTGYETYVLIRAPAFARLIGRLIGMVDDAESRS